MHPPTSSLPHTREPAGASALPLLALAIGTFGIGTTEFGPMGMLPTIAEGVGVSIPSAGLLISAYAIGVTLGAPVVTLMLARWPRRKALVALMAVFAIGNVLSAFAPNYLTLLVARVLTSLMHGAFGGIGSVVAASLVPRAKQASAVAAMFMGLTVANIGGVPSAAWISERIGWRESFMAIGALGLIAMGVLRAFLPKGGGGQPPQVRRELKVLLRPIVIQALLTTIAASASLFALYTYISPALTSITKATPGFITTMLAVVGIGFTIGNSLGGKLADRSVDKTVAFFLIVEALVMIAMPWLARTQVGASIGLFIWGIASFALVPPLQMRVMMAAAEAPGLASSVNIGAFNLGNAIGAALGATVLSAGLSYSTVMFAGAGMCTLALALVFWSRPRQHLAPTEISAQEKTCMIE